MRLIDAWLDQSQGRARPINTQRDACFGYSGDAPPEEMFRSLGLKRVTRVASLSGASS